jgi:hypothetical protein
LQRWERRDAGGGGREKSKRRGEKRERAYLGKVIRVS